MKAFLIILTSLLILVIFGGCDKGPELTPITQEGRNTFSCKVNGKVWVPDAKGSIFVTVKPIDGGFFNNSIDDSIRIWISAYASNGEEVHIYLESLTLGVRKLDKNTDPIGASFSPSNYGLYRNSRKEEYITSSVNTGSITLSKADTTTGILSGTFDFTVSNSKGVLARINFGRFDINSKTL